MEEVGATVRTLAIKRLIVIVAAGVITVAMLAACSQSAGPVATNSPESAGELVACDLVADSEVEAALKAEVSQSPDPISSSCEFRWGPGSPDDRLRNVGPGYGSLRISIINREHFEGLKSGEAGPKVDGVAVPMEPVEGVGDEAYMTKTVFPGTEPGVEIGKAQAELAIRTGDVFLSMTFFDDRSANSRPREARLFEAVVTLAKTAVNNV